MISPLSAIMADVMSVAALRVPVWPAAASRLEHIFSSGFLGQVSQAVFFVSFCWHGRAQVLGREIYRKRIGGPRLNTPGWLKHRL